MLWAQAIDDSLLKQSDGEMSVRMPQGFLFRHDLPLRRYLAMSVQSLGCQNWRGATALSGERRRCC